jgi:hypothetical protein
MLSRSHSSVLPFAPLTVAAGLVFATHATGAAPVIQTGTFSDTASPSSTLCGFPIVLSFQGTFQVTLFFDQDGNLVTAHLHSNDVATAVNPANGNTLTGHETVQIHADLVDVTEARMGVPLHFNVTGGSAVVDAGRIVVGPSGDVVFVSGNHEFLDGDLAGFCAALA